MDVIPVIRGLWSALRYLGILGMLSSLTVIYVDIINHLPACVNVGSIISRMAKPDQTSSSSPNGLERFLVMALLVCVTAKRNGEREREGKCTLVYVFVFIIIMLSTELIH